MEEVVTLIDEIIEEHKTIFHEFQGLEQIANDAEAVIGLDNAKDKFMPGRFDKNQGLKELEKLLKNTEQGIRVHFDREEGALLNAFEHQGNRNLASALHSLLDEHEILLDRLANLKQEVAKLASGNLSHQIWEATGYDMRVYLSHTRKLFEKHAEMEQQLLYKLRSELNSV